MRSGLNTMTNCTVQTKTAMWFLDAFRAFCMSSIQCATKLRGLYPLEWPPPLKGESIMESENIVRTIIHTGQQPTEAQIREIELAASRPISPDEDAPELTLEQYAEMAALAKARRNKQAKPVVALRISLDTLEKAKATGKGYTGFLSRLLDNAINDPQLVARSL